MPSRPRADRRPHARVLDALLVVTAALGLLVVAARVAGALLGLELVVFASGSMAPAYPQGSVAVAQRSTPEEVRVGDVVTVDRPGELPITHRVVRVAVRDGDAVLRLRGDANARPDPTAYRTAHPGRVLAPLPGWLAPLRSLGSPGAAAAAALLAATSVVWALWPTPSRSRAAAA